MCHINIELRNKKYTEYKKILENLNEIAFVLDKNGLIKYISPVVEDYFGYKPEEIVGKKLTDILLSEDKVKLSDINKKLKKMKLMSFECKVNNKNSRTFWIRISCRAVLKNNKVVSIYGIIIDITENKKIEGCAD